MSGKYILTDEERVFTHPLTGRQVTGYRIQATRTFSDVRSGSLGGFVSSEANLTHRSACWIYEDAAALDNSRVRLSACMKGSSALFDAAELTDMACMWDRSAGMDNAHIGGKSQLFGQSIAMREAQLTDYAMLRSQQVVSWNLSASLMSVTSADLKTYTYDSTWDRVHSRRGQWNYTDFMAQLTQSLDNDLGLLESQIHALQGDLSRSGILMIEALNKRKAKLMSKREEIIAPYKAIRTFKHA